MRSAPVDPEKQSLIRRSPRNRRPWARHGLANVAARSSQTAPGLRSLLLAARRSTMRLPNVFPSRTMAPVVSMFKTNLVAVPAFRRVEPLKTSGPTTGVIARSTTALRSASGLHASPMAYAPIVFA